MEPLRTTLTKAVSQLIKPNPVVTQQSQRKRPTFLLPRWAKQRITYLAKRRGVSTRLIFQQALALGLEQLLAERAAVEAWETLTPKEREVAALVCIGLSNEEICEELAIALSTVKGHTGNIFQKFQVENRTQLRSSLRWWDAYAWLNAEN